MLRFLIDFKDLKPEQNSTQSVEYESLEEAVRNVVVAVRDIVADHIRNGRLLTMTSIVIQDEAGIALTEVTVIDVIRELVVSVRNALNGD